jgi:hypothetical protein
MAYFIQQCSESFGSKYLHLGKVQFFYTLQTHWLVRIFPSGVRRCASLYCIISFLLKTLLLQEWA